MFEVQATNPWTLEGGGIAATGQPLLMGIVNASLATDSFIPAASHELATCVMSRKSVAGKMDELRGLKENAIIGRLIPALTVLDVYRCIHLRGEDEPEELASEVWYLSGIPSYAEQATQIFDAEIAEDQGFAIPSGLPKPPTPADFVLPAEVPSSEQ